MAEASGQSNEKAIWDLYLEKCKNDRTKPSVEDFKAWTKSLLSQL